MVIPRRGHPRWGNVGVEAEVVVVAGRRGSGGRGSGAVIMTFFCCASGVACGSTLVQIGVGMDLFNLNTKKPSVCRLVQNFTSLRASTCNAKALHVFVQRFLDPRAG